MKFTENNGCCVARTTLGSASVSVFASAALGLVVVCNSPLETFASLPSPTSPSVGPLPTASTSATASQSWSNQAHLRLPPQ